MYISVFNDPASVSASELRRDCEHLPPWRRSKVFSYIHLVDRVLCAKAYLLLREGLLKVHGIDGELDFVFGANGKPSLASHPGIHFNLSHCRRGVLCVIDERPVGCDIEEIPESLDIELLKRCANSEERVGILSSEAPEEEFAKLWTVKEAVLKLTGDGLVDNLPGLLTSGLLSRLDIETTVCREKGWVRSVARWK